MHLGFFVYIKDNAYIKESYVNKRLIQGITFFLFLSICTGAVFAEKKKKALPDTVTSGLTASKTIVVLGYNTTRYIQHEAYSSRIAGHPKKEKLSPSIEEEPRYPVGTVVNEHDKNFLEQLKKGPYTLVSKADLTTNEAYTKIKGDVTADVTNINAAQGYVLTYKYPPKKDGERGRAAGVLVNKYKEALTAVEADLGLIVVEEPFVGYNKASNSSAVCLDTRYIIIRPSTGNSVLYEKRVHSESTTTYKMEKYTEEDREKDEKTFMSQYSQLSSKNHALFIQWLNEVYKK